MPSFRLFGQGRHLWQLWPRASSHYENFLEAGRWLRRERSRNPRKSYPQTTMLDSLRTYYTCLEEKARTLPRATQGSLTRAIWRLARHYAAAGAWANSEGWQRRWGLTIKFHMPDFPSQTQLDSDVKFDCTLLKDRDTAEIECNF